MNTYILIATPVLVAVAAIFVGLGVVLVRHAYPAGARAAGLAMLAVAIWLVGAAGEFLAADSPALYRLVLDFKYVGVAGVAPLYLVFVLRYALGLTPSRTVLAALSVIPALTILAVWTNPAHELMWSEPFPPLGRGEWGPWFLRVHTPYSYAAILAGTGGLILEMVRGQTLRRAQSSILVLGALVPLAVNLVYLSNPGLPDLAQTPLAFAFTALVFGWGFLRLRLFQLSPLALRAAFDAVADGIVMVDEEGRVSDLNPPAGVLLGLDDREAVLGETVEHVLRRAGVPRVELVAGEPRDVPLADGRRIEVHVRAIVDRQGERARGWIMVLRDVTHQRRAEGALRESEAMVRSLLDRSPIGIVRLSPLRNQAGRIRDFVCILANPTATDYLGNEAMGLVGRSLTEIRPPHTALLLDTLRRVLRTGEPEETVFQVERSSGETRWYRTNAVALGTDLSLTFVDVTGERLLQQEMTVAAHTDPLTGLLNRRGLEKDGGLLLQSAATDSRPVALLYLDLDAFKDVNDNYGHDGGDAALREFARRLVECVRAEDLVARLGGDEFVVLLQEAVPGTVEEVVRRIHAAALRPYLLPRGEVRIQASVGSASFPDGGATLSDLLSAADGVMYAIKGRPS